MIIYRELYILERKPDENLEKVYILNCRTLLRKDLPENKKIGEKSEGP